MPFQPLPPDESLFQLHRVYALIDHVEPENPERGELSEIYFDCVSADWVDERARRRDFGLDSCRDAPASVVRLVTRAGEDPFSLETATGGEWLTLYLDNKKNWRGSLPVEHYASISHNPVNRFLDKHEKTGGDIAAALTRLTSLEPVPDATEGAIEATLGPVPPAEEVAVYDIGHGNSNGLRTGMRTSVYFDFGGGTLNNCKTYPANIKFCLKRSPPVILSHWDWDHWASADREPRALELKWIVPRQRIGVNHARLAATLHLRGNLLVWPRKLQRKHTRFGLVQKCTGTSRNDSGLAVLVAVIEDELAYQQYTGVLLPGDAQYSKIPDSGSGKLSGLVITHHGGKLRDLRIPKPDGRQRPKLVCSNGEPNSYKHPYDATLDAHRNAGWGREVRTAQTSTVGRGHVGIWLVGPPTQLACGGRDCNTRITK